MAEMKITTEQLTETAGKIRSTNNTLKGLLESFSKSVTDLESTWQSDAGEHTKSAIKSLEPRFDEYFSVVSTYADFLDKTAESYATNEKNLTNNADNVAAFS